MTAPRIIVTVAYAAPGIEAIVDVRLEPGACVADAVASSGIVTRLKLEPTQLEFAIFGQRVPGATPLRDGDRVELTRPLLADPEHIRRARAGKRTAPKTAGPAGNKR